MVLSDEELQRIYVLLTQASLGQLVALGGLCQGLVEVEVKSSQDDLALCLDKYEREAKK